MTIATTRPPVIAASASTYTADDPARRLQALARRIEAGDPQADAALRALMDDLAAPGAGPGGVELMVFAAGLARRLAGDSLAQANLYLTPFDVPQIELFNLLGRAVPFVGLATSLCNAAILQAIEGQPLPTLIDVGIGTGRQFALLLHEIAARPQVPEHITIVGIEPAGAALAEARRHLMDTAAALGLSVGFVGIARSAEALSAADWLRVRRACTARPVINASFALHHIADNATGHDQRNAVLRRLRALDPVRLVLAEPDVDHLTRSLEQRFRHAFTHFGAVFRTLDALPLAQRERDALKVGFFGREISDILGAPEAQRSERHESAAQWQARLQACGFEDPADGAAGFGGSGAAMGAQAGGVQVAAQAGHLSLRGAGEPVVALFACCPSAHRAPAIGLGLEAAIA